MSNLLVVLIDGINYAAWLFLSAVGLTLIYGVMRVLNVAHASFYSFGCYVAVTIAGYWFTHNYPPYLSFFALFSGSLIERFLLRYQYAKDEVVILLITYAVFLILDDVLKLIWGVDPYYASDPYELLGNFEIGGMTYPNYYILMVVAALILGCGLTYMLKMTKFGKLLVSVIHDREISSAMGINVGRVFSLTFAFGCALAAIAGGITTPTISVVPGLGVDVIVLSFAVVVTGGLGSLPGTALAAIIMGVVRSFCVHYVPQLELFVIFTVMALVLVFRPRGLFSLAEARKI